MRSFHEQILPYEALTCVGVCCGDGNARKARLYRGSESTGNALSAAIDKKTRQH